jgi:hypothetical protein
MTNPWEEIPLSDYENHMKLDSVMQLQAMNDNTLNPGDNATRAEVATILMRFIENVAK